MAGKPEPAETGMLGSKYLRLLLVIVAGLFTFGAPYVTMIASNYLHRGAFFSFSGGFLSLAIGLLLIWYLIKRKVIT